MSRMKRISKKRKDALELLLQEKKEKYQNEMGAISEKSVESSDSESGDGSHTDSDLSNCEDGDYNE